jgi:predicted dehydrogenase
MLDLFGYLVGDAAQPVEVGVTAPPPGVGGPPGDNFVATLRYTDGSLCTLTYSVLGRKDKHNGKERIEALWDGKSYIIDDFTASRGYGCTPGSAASATSKGHLEELQALGKHLSKGGPCPLTLEATERATLLSFDVDAACRSAQAVSGEGSD